GLPKFNEQQMMFNLENINLPSMNTPQVVDCLFTLYYDWNYVTGLKLFGYSKMNMGQSNHKGINNTLILDKENLKTVKIVNWEVKAEDVFLALDKSRE
ncbi:10782_t:CDS:1, partial [Diversispora eburnea]